MRYGIEVRHKFSKKFMGLVWYKFKSDAKGYHIASLESERMGLAYGVWKIEKAEEYKEKLELWDGDIYDFALIPEDEAYRIAADKSGGSVAEFVLRYRTYYLSSEGGLTRDINNAKRLSLLIDIKYWLRRCKMKGVMLNAVRCDGEE